jgi:hypothetical protein
MSASRPRPSAYLLWRQPPGRRNLLTQAHQRGFRASTCNKDPLPWAVLVEMNVHPGGKIGLLDQ